MVVLMFKNLDIPKGFTHKASDWQIATDKHFKKDSIVKESKDDEKNLTSILFDVDLDPDKKYYARARVIMDYGPSDWSDIDIVRTEDLDSIDLDMDIPSVVATPEITIDFPFDKVPPTMFTINTSTISTNSNAKHLSTDYIITDLLGNVMYMETDSTDNLTKHLVSTIMLPEDNFYLIKASHTSTSGDISPLSQKTIYIPGNNVVKVNSSLKSDNASKVGLNVELEQVDDVDKIYVSLYMVGADEPIETYSVTEDKFVFDIPKEAFQNPIGTYLMSVEYEFKNGEKTGDKYFKLVCS